MANGILTFDLSTVQLMGPSMVTATTLPLPSTFSFPNNLGSAGPGLIGEFVSVQGRFDNTGLQRWAGHKDINVTMGYTAWLAAESSAARLAADREDSRYAIA